jgi:hypothetical protein
MTSNNNKIIKLGNLHIEIEELIKVSNDPKLCVAINEYMILDKDYRNDIIVELNAFKYPKSDIVTYEDMIDWFKTLNEDQLQELYNDSELAQKLGYNKYRFWTNDIIDGSSNRELLEEVYFKANPTKTYLKNFKCDNNKSKEPATFKVMCPSSGSTISMTPDSNMNTVCKVVNNANKNNETDDELLKRTMGIALAEYGDDGRESDSEVIDNPDINLTRYTIGSMALKIKDLEKQLSDIKKIVQN